VGYDAVVKRLAALAVLLAIVVETFGPCTHACHRASAAAQSEHSCHDSGPSSRLSDASSWCGHQDDAAALVAATSDQRVDARPVRTCELQTAGAFRPIDLQTWTAVRPLSWTPLVGPFSLLSQPLRI
jgi:hypothetical protein